MFTVVGGLHTDPSDPSDKTEWDDEYNLDTFRELYKVCSNPVPAFSKLPIRVLLCSD